MLAFSANAFGVLKDVDARGNKCNVDPTLNQVDVILANKTPDQFRDALATDPVYRALVGDVTLSRHVRSDLSGNAGVGLSATG
jgi:hypothetical protein